MRKLTSLGIILLLGVTCLFAQNSRVIMELDVDGVFIKKHQKIPAERPFKLTRVAKQSNSDGTTGVYLLLSIEGEANEISLPIKKVSAIELYPQDVPSYWKSQFIMSGMVQHLNKKGYSYSLRNELLEDSRSYLSELENANLLYEDIIIEDYVQKIFSRIAPKDLDKNFPELKGVSILKSPSPDSYMLPGGILVITTGLLSVLDSEEELVAIMSSELAHYVLDHHVVNIQRSVSQARKAVIWSTVLSGIAFVADEYLSYKNEYYLPGTLSLSAGVVSVGVLNSVSKHLGMEYSLSQKHEGDNLAMGVLESCDMDPGALRSALNKIHNYYQDRKDFYPLSAQGQYYQINNRIRSLKKSEKEFNDLNYKWKISAVTTYNAISQIYLKDYPTAYYFINKNIESDIAIDEDYVVLAKTIMALYNDNESNEKSLKLINQAIAMGTAPNLNAYKQKIIALIRLDRKAEISEAIRDYADLLKRYQSESYTDGETSWILSEFAWIDRLRGRYW